MKNIVQIKAAYPNLIACPAEAVPKIAAIMIAAMENPGA